MTATFIMASHPTLPYVLRSRHYEFSSTSSSDLAASSVLPVASTLFRASSVRAPLPPSLAKMPPRPSLIPPITRPVGSETSAQSSHPVLHRLLLRAPHSVNLPSSSVPLVASSQPLVPPSSAPVELPPVICRLDHEATIIPTDSIASDVQPLPSTSVDSSARVIVVNDLASPLDLHDEE